MSNQVCKNPRKENWLKRNYIAILFLVALFSYNLISHWINLYFYLGVLVLVLANLFFFTEINTIKEKKFKPLNMFLSVNLFALFAITIFVVITTVFNYSKDFIPEQVSNIASIGLIIVAFFYLVGIAFYYLERSNEN